MTIPSATRDTSPEIAAGTACPRNDSLSLRTGYAPLWTNYDQLVAPYVADVHDVLTGRAARCKLRYNGATIVFHHGCVLTRIAVDERLFALPPFELDETGRPAIRTAPDRRHDWLESLSMLPRDILLFYFTLLKTVFESQALTARYEAPRAGATPPVPAALRAILEEVGWPVRQAGLDARHCRP